MLQQLIEEINNGIRFKHDNQGNILKKERGLIPVIDDEATRYNMENIAEKLFGDYKTDFAVSILKQCISIIKDNYVETHDGFKAVRSIQKGKRIGVGDIYAFSVAVGYIYEFLTCSIREDGTRVGIGTLYPAGQDAGKNLIKLVWKSEGYDVIDLGKKLKPKQFVQAIQDERLSVIGVSCMANKCIDSLDDLLQLIKENNIDIPVIIGGIAVNRVIAFNLSQKYNIYVYYGHDVNDAEDILRKTISKEAIEIPDVKTNKRFPVDEELSSIIDKHNFRLTLVDINDIIVDTDSRKGCTKCSGDKKKICPLELGYERQKTLEESRELINRFKFAILVSTEVPDESKRQTCKSIWLHLLKLEQYLGIKYRDVFTFKFPMICPFCRPSDCKLKNGECMLPAYYRPLHEQYNINIGETLKRVYGDDIRAEIHSIILAGRGSC